MTQPLALIVEDDLKLADIFAHALQAAQFETEIVGDGQQAVTRLAEIIPSVVVLDLHLPHLNGEIILQKIRADARLADTRVILATADPHTAETLHQQADLILIKPISFSQLRDLATRLRPQVE